MSRPHKLVAIVGSTSTTSRTRVLVEAIVAALASQGPYEVEWLELSALAAHIGNATTPDALTPTGSAAVRAIEQADLIVAATPVYKGSFAGLFKHLIDFVHPEALVERPVLLAATGGSDRHALVVDQALRPLFSFFRAQTVPSAVYAAESDFDGYTLSSSALAARIAEAVDQAHRLVQAGATARPLRAAA